MTDRDMMTDRDHAAFPACYAAAWFQSTARFEPGVITDTERAAIAAAHADRMVKALRECRPEILGDECGCGKPDCPYRDGGREP